MARESTSQPSSRVVSRIAGAVTFDTSITVTITLGCHCLPHQPSRASVGDESSDTASQELSCEITVSLLPLR